MSTDDFQLLFEELQTAFVNPESLSTDALDLHAFSQSKYPQFTGAPHAIVVHVNSTEDVVKVVRLASKYRVPVVPYTAVACVECICRSLETISGSFCRAAHQLVQFADVPLEEDSHAICEAGVVWNKLNDLLKSKGIPLFFPLDPGIGATIGGMISQGCSGTNAVRYGTARGELVLNVTAVLPSGEVIKTRNIARKCAAGFDLTKLFIGAEGTLGIITEATIRLMPRLPTSVAVVSFPDVQSATQAVTEALNHGAAIRKRCIRSIVSAIVELLIILSPVLVTECAELVDDLYIRAVKNYGTYPMKWVEADTVLFKFQGSETVRADTSRLVENVSNKYGGYGYMHITKEDEVDLLWSDRKNALFGLLQMYPGSKGFITDVCVPVSKLPDLIVATKHELASRNLVSPLGGHVGDGNFHCFIMYRNEEELALVREVVDAMIQKAIALDGTCTGEHGVGLGKKEYLVRELGEGTVSLMKAIKATIDPLNLFNPGKLYPD
ncbi:FAD-binding domain-containing protein [Sanghuangporus baumii]|uniref:D-lactate dehydrogenase (cytochrome) n=1 Tax=Sanghuangporus baumii TaxID=108892 RepID=A0A9Q5HSD4_SANBA|nr:FAD-binding domain-containing protein [Sanghuangporus baumii]